MKVTGPSVVIDQTIDPNNQGWAVMNSITRGSRGAFVWEDVYNYNSDNQKDYITFTLTPGTYTLQVAYRETAAMLDAIEIRQVGE